MTRDQILDVLQDTTGHPSSGPVAEWLPALADAIDAALNPKPKAKRFDTAEVDAPQ